MIDCEQLLRIKYDKTEISKKRDTVRRSLLAVSENIRDGKISAVDNNDLLMFFELYDRYFFYNYFNEVFKGKVSFSLSTRMSKSAGKVVAPKNQKSLNPQEERYDIRMGIDFFFKYDELSREKAVNGIVTKDSLEAFQLVFEHELCHLIELHCFYKSSCKSKRFKALATNIFGHEDSYHRLPTAGEIAGERYGLKPGDEVVFDCEGKRLSGFIQAINKKATVMVPDKKGIYMNKQGKRFQKWYVPPDSLQKEK